MNLYHLRYFSDAARLGGVSSAAKENFVTQSAVSRAIKSLEEEFGTSLVIHGQNRFQLTEVGEAIYGQARNVFNETDQLHAIAQSYSDTLKGPLRFACNHAIASHLLGPLLPRIQSQYPEIDVSMRLGNTDQVQSMVQSGEVDFGVALNDGELENEFTVKDFFEDTFVLVKAPHFQEPLSSINLITSRTKKGGMSNRYVTAFRSAYGRGIFPKTVIPGWQVIRDLAIEGYGYALVPRFICNGALKSRLLQVHKHKVKPIKFSLCTFVRKNRVIPKNALALLDHF